MKLDPQREIRQHYIDLLTGITVKGKEIPVINLAKVGQQLPYILVFGGSIEGADTKGTYNDRVSVNVQVHTDFKGNYGGESWADDIATEILKRRYPEGKPGEYGYTDNFRIVTCTRSIQETARIETATSVHILRQITFNHFVEQL
jgi:hypothetical protein